MNSDKRIELLAPAGSLEALDAAIGEGADAVYLGLRDFNARSRAKNFSYKQFEAIVEKVHILDKKVFVTLNTVFEERETKIMYNLLKYLNAVKPDGVIIQDLGTLAMAFHHFPQLALHASTQMNISSTEGVNLLSKYNVKRVVLSRELDFEQIKEIRSKTGSQLEIFAHGALCVSVSGNCLFSSYFGGKSANRGRCTQACRRLYSNDSNPTKSNYLFSLNDLSLIKQIPEIEAAGINSLKIEGRMKSYQYIATVVKAFRLMIDNYPNDRATAYAKAKELLESDFARRKTEYLFTGKLNDHFVSKDRSGQTGLYSGLITKISKEESLIYLSNNNNGINKGDTLRIQSNDDRIRHTTKVLEVNKDNSIHITLPEDAVLKKEYEVYITNKLEFKHSYPMTIPSNLDKYKKHPAITALPRFTPTLPSKTIKLNDGIYVKIDKTSDLHLIQSEKPTKVIFQINSSNFEEFLSVLPKTQFVPSDCILYLEPYFDVNRQNFLVDAIRKLIEKGFELFMPNNVGQLNILKRHSVTCIAGPYLYTFNQYALYFLNDFSIRYAVSPIENSKKNLFMIREAVNTSEQIVTVFGYPELFKIVPQLDGVYNQKILIDVQNNYEFQVDVTDGMTSVIPQLPFSITDKIDELKQKGFKKYIVDLSHLKLTKSLYKNIIKAVKNSEHMEQTTRFNWKEGFYFDMDKSKSTKIKQ